MSLSINRPPALNDSALNMPQSLPAVKSSLMGYGQNLMSPSAQGNSPAAMGAHPLSPMRLYGSSLMG